jgi:hypothetical protein
MQRERQGLQLPEKSLTWMERGLAREGGGGSPGGGPLLSILCPVPI